MHPFLAVILVVLLLPSHGCRSRQSPAQATRDPKARAVLNRAIKATGGLALLKRKLARYTVHAVIAGEKGDLETTAHWIAPDRLVLSFTDWEIRHLGESCAMVVKGKTKECPAIPELNNEAVLFRTHVTDIYPLLGAGVVSTYRGTVADRSGDRLLEQVEVDNRSRTATIMLYFDRKTGLLARTEHKATRDGRSGVSSTDYHDHRRIDGVQVAMRLVAYFDQKQTSVTRIKKVQLGWVDQRRFAPP